MSRFWPAHEPAQAAYERLREQILLGACPEYDLAALRFRHCGLTGLITKPTIGSELVAEVVGSPRPRWSGQQDPRLDALAETYALLTSYAEREGLSASGARLRWRPA